MGVNETSRFVIDNGRVMIQIVVSLMPHLHETARIGPIFAVQRFMLASDRQTSHCTQSDKEIGKFLSQKSDGQPGKIGRT